jgi:hypothetical protein
LKFRRVEEDPERLAGPDEPAGLEVTIARRPPTDQRPQLVRAEPAPEVVGIAARALAEDPALVARDREARVVVVVERALRGPPGTARTPISARISTRSIRRPRYGRWPPELGRDLGRLDLPALGPLLDDGGIGEVDVQDRLGQLRGDEPAAGLHELAADAGLLVRHQRHPERVAEPVRRTAVLTRPELDLRVLLDVGGAHQSALSARRMIGQGSGRSMTTQTCAPRRDGSM